MDKLNQKITTIEQALGTLEQAIQLYHEYEKKFKDSPLPKNESLFLGMRDSMIQRFEYCVDLFWKVLKIYLEEVEKVKLPTHSPRGIIREAVKVKTITENEGAACMVMIDNRNLTSHIYHEEIAQDIAHEVPKAYNLMKLIVVRLRQNIEKK